MESLIQYLGCGRIQEESKRSIVNFIVSKFDDNNNSENNYFNIIINECNHRLLNNFSKNKQSHKTFKFLLKPTTRVRYFNFFSRFSSFIN